MKGKVLGVFGGVSGPWGSILVSLAALKCVPTRSELLIESKSLLQLYIAPVFCVLAIASAYFIAAADTAFASAVNVDVIFCVWHSVPGLLVTRLGTWIFMGSGMSSIRACHSRDEFDG